MLDVRDLDHLRGRVVLEVALVIPQAAQEPRGLEIEAGQGQGQGLVKVQEDQELTQAYSGRSKMPW